VKQQRTSWTQEQKVAKLDGKALQQQQKQEQKELKKQQEKAWKKGNGMLGVEEEGTPAAAVPPVLHAHGQPAASPLQTLAEMGFDNIELNAQILEAHGDNIHKTLEVLISLMDYSTME